MSIQNVVMPTAVSEIEASPKGSKVIAFFDLDGTFINGFTVAHLSKDRIKNRDLGLDEVRNMISVGLDAAVGKAGFEDMIAVGAASWKGRSDEELNVMADRIFIKDVRNSIYPEMRQILRAHRRQGHTIVLSSSATSYQVEPVARFLEIDNVICNRFEMSDGILTGQISEPVIWGKTKATEAQRFARQAGVDLKDCYFYADGDEDAALMYLVGNPRPTNPRKKLAQIAEKRGWPVQRFTSRDQNGPLRSIGGWASIIPAGLKGLHTGLLQGDKRAGINVASANWFKALFEINGVTLNVVGEENLWKVRPAIFIFNHRNNFDPLLTAMLVEKDFSSVAKKDLEDDWLMGTLGKIGDIAFIDRADSSGSVNALKPLEELARKGISIMLSPEGTRHDTDTVGPFKKGAFRMAMATGLPIVPIVFRNAEMIAARDATVMCPGTVDVAVLEPLLIEAWTLANLEEKIASVRQLYIDTLESWPASFEA